MAARDVHMLETSCSFCHPPGHEVVPLQADTQSADDWQVDEERKLGIGKEIGTKRSFSSPFPAMLNKG